MCCWFCHGASLLAPKAVSIGLRNCRVARFGQALKPSKASQQLSKASAPHNPLQQLSKRPAGFAMVPPCAFLLALQAVSIGLRNCRVARFGQALKPSKASQQLSKASAPHNPPQQLSKRAAGFAMVPPCAFLLALQAVSSGLRNCRVARFGEALKPSKLSQQLSKASAPHNPPQQLSKCAAGFAMVPPCAFLLALQAVSIGLRNCRKSLAAAFDGLSTAQSPQQLLRVAPLLCHGTSLGPTSCFYIFSWLFTSLSNFSACTAVHTVRFVCFGFARIHAQTKLASGTVGTCAHAASFPCSRRPSPHKTACRTSSQQLSKASAPHNPPQQLSKRAAGFAMVPPCAFLLALQAVSIGLRNCRVARFGQALKPSKLSQQLSKASAPHNPPQQLSKCAAGFAMVPPCAFLLALQAVSIGLRNCRKSLAAAFDGLSTAQSLQQLLRVAPLLCHGTSLGPTSCFYIFSWLFTSLFNLSLEKVTPWKGHLSLEKVT